MNSGRRHPTEQGGFASFPTCAASGERPITTLNLYASRDRSGNVKIFNHYSHAVHDVPRVSFELNRNWHRRVQHERSTIQTYLLALL